MNICFTHEKIINLLTWRKEFIERIFERMLETVEIVELRKPSLRETKKN